MAADGRLRCAYADPPYLGQGGRYGYPEWNHPGRHAELIAQLVSGYPDGWALSCSTGSLRVLLPMCPDSVRVGAWVKPFASFKPGVNPAYAWEPVIWRGGRQPRGREEATVRDWHAANITLRRGLCGVKPASFARWVFNLLGLRHGDELCDLFPGSGIMTRTFAEVIADGR